MRREVVASYLKLAGALLVGLVVGRFGLPRIEPQTTYYVTIFPTHGQRECAFGVIDDTTVLGRRIGYGEEYNALNCREDRPFGNAVLGCRCPEPP